MSSFSLVFMPRLILEGFIACLILLAETLMGSLGCSDHILYVATWLDSLKIHIHLLIQSLVRWVETWSEFILAWDQVVNFGKKRARGEIKDRVKPR